MHKIIKLGLDSRARELKREGLSIKKISEQLSKESEQNIPVGTVFNFFKLEENSHIELIEKNSQLKAVVVEAEVSTIEDRKKVIKGLLELAENAEYDRDKVAAYKVATEALDSLDKRLGKLTGNSGVTINNINAMKLSDIPTDQLRRLIDDARCRSH